MSDASGFERLLDIMAHLRGPSGCPWDKEQTHRSLEPYLIEEAYEVIEAIEKKDPVRLREELGDLLLQVIFHAQIALENQDFSIDDVLDGIIEKLVRRHPHVFGDLEISTPEEVVTHWEEIKRGEKQQPSVLANIPSYLPALHYSFMLQKKAAKVGFDWEEKEDILLKLEEEIEELKKVLPKGKKGGKNRAVEEELGDIIFTTVNLARRFEIDPEIALHKVTTKFKKRFEYLERKAKEKGKELRDMTLDEMEELWEDAKTYLRSE